MDVTNKEKKLIDYDDLLSAAGELGCYQWRLFFITFPFFAFGAFVSLSQIFITEVSANHWCKIPELANLTVIERRALGVPKDENGKFGYSQCKMYSVNWTEVLATGEEPNANWTTIPCQYGWEFNKTEIPYPTIGSDMEWVCDKSSYQANAQGMFYVGCIIGGLIFGWVADRFGRIPAIIGSCVTGCLGGFTSTFARNFIEFTAARFVLGMSFDTCMIMPYLLILEYVAPKYRTLLANLAFAIFFALFITVLPWIALACGHWKIISMATSLPLALALFTKLFLPESPRWLLSKGRIDEAIDKVLLISRVNKKVVSTHAITQFKSSMANVKENKEEYHDWTLIFKRPLLRKAFILVCLEYMCCVLLVDALVRSIGQLDFDFFVSFSVISFTESPALLVVAFIMDFIGRRWLCIASMAVTCIFCSLLLFARGAQSLIFAVIARFAVNMSLSAALQWAPEILPTSVRGTGTAIAHMSSFAATFLSPYIVYLEVYHHWLPLAILSAIAAFATLIPFALPETAMKGMPNTIEEAEKLTTNQRLMTLPYLECRKDKRTKELRQMGQLNHSFEPEVIYL